MGAADCEAIRSGFLAQPANAVSALAFVAAGLYVLRRRRWVAWGGGLLAVGAGSFAYHGPQPGWAGFAHDAPIAWLALVGAVQAGAGLRRSGTMLRGWKPAAGLMAGALLAYVAGRTASDWCRPQSLWQWHAAWHALGAVALGFLQRTSSAAAWTR